jgi:hypothetical protein
MAPRGPAGFTTEVGGDDTVMLTAAAHLLLAEDDHLSDVLI